MNLETFTQIYSQIGWLLNIIISITLARTQLHHSVENTMLVSYFGANFGASISSLIGCPQLSMTVFNLAAQASLLSIVWKVAIVSKISHIIYFFGVWIPTTSLIYLSSPTCQLQNNLSAVTNITTLFFSAMTITLGSLVTYTSFSSKQQLINRKKYGFLRLMAVVLFDSALTFTANINFFNRARLLVIYTLQFIHLVLVPIFFLALHNGVRTNLIRVTKRNEDIVVTPKSVRSEYLSYSPDQFSIDTTKYTSSDQLAEKRYYTEVEVVRASNDKVIHELAERPKLISVNANGTIRKSADAFVDRKIMVSNTNSNRNSTDNLNESRFRPFELKSTPVGSKGQDYKPRVIGELRIDGNGVHQSLSVNDLKIYNGSLAGALSPQPLSKQSRFTREAKNEYK